MAKLIVTKSHDYRWPSGSITAFKASSDAVTTRRICVEHAVAKGFGYDPEAKTKPTGGMVAKGNYILDTGLTESFMPASDKKIVAS